MATVACQTDVSEPIRPSVGWLKYNAGGLGYFVTEKRSLLMTLKKHLRTHLKMPSMQNATMHITIPFSTIPVNAWMALFPSSMMEWHQQQENMKNTFTGLMLDPMKVMTCPTLDLSTVMDNAHGPCKAVLQSSSNSGAQSVLSYVPPVQLWHQARSDGTMESMVSLFMVVLDESGELRTPPNQAYTDPEISAIREAVLYQTNQLQLLRNVTLSPHFEQLLEDWELLKLRDCMQEEGEGDMEESS